MRLLIKAFANLAPTGSVHPKVVQERLGHSTISMTLDTYSHVVPGMQERAAAELEKRLFAEPSQKDLGRTTGRLP